METFRHPVEIGNITGTEYELVNPIVDTRLLFSSMPPSLLERLGVPRMRDTTVPSPDGNWVKRAAGEAYVRLLGRAVPTVVVFGDEDAEPILGRLALEGLGFEADPENKRFVDMVVYLPTALSEEDYERLFGDKAIEQK